MTVSTTTRLGQNQWSAGTDPFTRAQVNADNLALENLAAIATAGTFAARPAAAASNNRGFYYATDTGDLYYSTGSAWIKVTLPADTVIRTAWTYVFPGDVKVGAAPAGGAADSVGYGIITVPAGQAVSLVGYKWTLRAGTSFTFSIKHYTGATLGTVSTLASGIVATSSAVKGSGTFTAKVCADGDSWLADITAISGTPNAGSVAVLADITI